MELRPETAKHKEVHRVAFQTDLTRANGRAEAEERP
jgi:hypothetical protein